jgi:hypothetical protein
VSKHRLPVISVPYGKEPIPQETAHRRAESANAGKNNESSRETQERFWLKTLITYQRKSNLNAREYKYTSEEKREANL